MRWPETGLTFVPTSPLVRDFATVIGYAMIGPGCEFSGHLRYGRHVLQKLVSRLGALERFAIPGQCVDDGAQEFVAGQADYCG